MGAAVISRRDFLVALGLSVPAAAAMKMLPSVDAGAGLPSTPDRLPAAATVPPGWPGVVVWIDGVAYAVAAVKGAPRVTYVNTTSFDSDCAVASAGQMDGHEVSIQLLGKYEPPHNRPAKFSIRMGEQTVEFESWISSAWRREREPGDVRTFVSLIVRDARWLTC